MNHFSIISAALRSAPLPSPGNVPTYVGLAICGLVGATAGAAENESEVIDAGGGFAENSHFRSHFSVGEGFPAQSVAANEQVILGGFMNTFVLHPLLDNDEDGLIDEIDLDDDNDFLGDRVEITGSAFSPSTRSNLFLADTDGDGAGDGEEAHAGTNPLDFDAVLRVIKVESSGGNMSLEWSSRGGKTYQVFWSPDLVMAPSLLDTVIASGGIAPWFETTSETILPMPVPDRAFFIVKPLP